MGHKTIPCPHPSSSLATHACPVTRQSCYRTFECKTDFGNMYRFAKLLLLGVSNIRKRVMFNTLQGQLDTYSAILLKINATERVIDFLKMDVEGAEIQFFEDVLAHNVSLLANVKQIGMEIHPNVDTNRRDQLWKYMHHLAALNFQLVSMEPNHWSLITSEGGRQASNSYELVWVNEKFKQ
ncbi:uncharacterized protein LOC108672592 [Hyalella azteca]|uniref:Uncharacterized protein LOC108672592 n=1 Tax=Hyalella azteca TaxID=294128 RepID=A0A8B7NQ23_HYAAZ|nr:uncharacterized protein LOC108672592 [Hyalella azteca]